eukprot:scaffold4396_cov196-Pinguiococcus_pyrenoidosus.AAC.8
MAKKTFSICASVASSRCLRKYAPRRWDALSLGVVDTLLELGHDVLLGARKTEIHKGDALCKIRNAFRLSLP